MIAVGYRISSKTGTAFRQWATQTLKQHIPQGYSINKSRIQANYDQFMIAVSQVQEMLPKGNKIQSGA